MRLGGLVDDSGAETARVRKPRLPQPLPLTMRLDDASGELLEEEIMFLRKRVKTMWLKAQRVTMPVWTIPSAEGPERPIERGENAVTPGTPCYGYALSLLELSDSHSKTQPFEVPKHSWLLAVSAAEKSMKLVPGMATSHEEARDRVEACWCIAMGAIADG